VVAMKNLSGSSEAITSMLRALGMTNTETMKKVMVIQNAIKISVGGIQIIRGIMSILKHKEIIETIRAEALIGSRLLQGPSGWAIIASASVASVAVAGSLYAVQNYHKKSFDMEDKYQRDSNAQDLGRTINGG
jgi:hypothetical protein